MMVVGGVYFKSANAEEIQMIKKHTNITIDLGVGSLTATRR